MSERILEFDDIRIFALAEQDRLCALVESHLEENGEFLSYIFMMELRHLLNENGDDHELLAQSCLLLHLMAESPSDEIHDLLVDQLSSLEQSPPFLERILDHSSARFAEFYLEWSREWGQVWYRNLESGSPA